MCTHDRSFIYLYFVFFRLFISLPGMSSGSPSKSSKDFSSLAWRSGQVGVWHEARRRVWWRKRSRYRSASASSHLTESGSPAQPRPGRVREQSHRPNSTPLPHYSNLRTHTHTHTLSPKRSLSRGNSHWLSYGSCVGSM